MISRGIDLEELPSSMFEHEIISSEKEQQYVRVRDRIRKRIEDLEGRMISANGETAQMEKKLQQERRRYFRTRNWIIERNMKLVASISGWYWSKNPDMDFGDIHGEFLLQTLGIVDKFKEKPNGEGGAIKLSTYLTSSLVKNAHRLHKKWMRDWRGYHQFSRHVGGEDSETELGSLLEDKRTPDSLHGPVLREFLLYFNSLDPEDKELLRHRYGHLISNDFRTLRGYGTLIGVTGERVRKIQKKSQEKLEGCYKKKTF